jgi:hypothetical protein
MKTYTGTKVIKAKPMTKREYCDYRGWNVPEGEDPNEEVYLVEYEADPSSKPNHQDHEGYISMSPKHVFDKAYKPSGTHIERLAIEKNELDKKLTSLSKALFDNNVPVEARPILVEQMNAMSAYLLILYRRLDIE